MRAAVRARIARPFRTLFLSDGGGNAFHALTLNLLSAACCTALLLPVWLGVQFGIVPAKLDGGKLILCCRGWADPSKALHGLSWNHHQFVLSSAHLGEIQRGGTHLFVASVVGAITQYAQSVCAYLFLERVSPATSVVVVRRARGARPSVARMRPIARTCARRPHKSPAIRTCAPLPAPASPSYHAQGTARKPFIVIISVAVFAKPITLLNVYGIALAFGGVGWYNYARYVEKRHQHVKLARPGELRASDDSSSSSGVSEGDGRRESSLGASVHCLAATGKEFVAWYEERLQRTPLLIKAITSGVLYGAGDVLAQTTVASHSSLHVYGTTFDSARFCRAVLYGGVFYPPYAPRALHTLAPCAHRRAASPALAAERTPRCCEPLPQG